MDRANASREYEAFDMAYRESILHLREAGCNVAAVLDPTSVGSGFGSVRRPTREIIGYQFCLRNPRKRLLSPSLRRINLPFAIANTIWTLKGASDLETIGFYNSRGHRFSSDGIQIEAAFGDRLFNQSDQILHALRRIGADRESRRAFAAIYQPSDTVEDHPGVPCAVGLHFMLRNDRLDLNVLMRSQSAAAVMPYDVFLFSMIHEVAAHRLHTPMGRYHHYASSFHYYDDEFELVEQVCKSQSDDSVCQMPEMPPAGEEVFEEVFFLEQEIRRRSEDGTLDSLDLRSSSLATYWQHLLAVLLIYALRKDGRNPQEDKWCWLPDEYRRLLW